MVFHFTFYVKGIVPPLLSIASMYSLLHELDGTKTSSHLCFQLFVQKKILNCNSELSFFSPDACYTFERHFMAAELHVLFKVRISFFWFESKCYTLFANSCFSPSVPRSFLMSTNHLSCLLIHLGATEAYSSCRSLAHVMLC